VASIGGGCGAAVVPTSYQQHGQCQTSPGCLLLPAEPPWSTRVGTEVYRPLHARPDARSVPR